ncbi:MAG: uroporphyrinogen-III C-methyltransferase [Candidatus Eremiobacteraeota bacterium]|nr:uroporphyrinogen-III C-methyltransferase [Candidatus Eremiobacteraeota bacterium]
MPRSRPAQGKVSLVGAGPGDPGLLTLKAARALRNADVLLHDYLASEATVALASESCEKIYVGKTAGAHTLSQDEINALIVRKAREGKRVVRLKGGDPFVFGRGAEEAQVLHEAGIAFEIIPGISSAIAAPAYAGIPVTHRAHNVAFTVLTGHEDPTKPESGIDWSRYAAPNQTLVLLMAMGNLAAIVKKLRDNGLSDDTRVAVIREGTRPTQQTLVGTLATIVDEVQRAQIGAPAIVVIGDVVQVREELRWFDTGPLFAKRVLITRPAGSNAAFESELLERGAQPVLAPVIAIGPPDDPVAARQAVEFISEYHWVVFTSQKGVQAFFAHLREMGEDARYLRHTRVAAIGPKTAEALLAHGIHANLVPDRYVSEKLAAALDEHARPSDRILLFRAQEGREVIENAESVAAYKTSIVLDPDFEEKVTSADILTFTSASTVKGFVENLGEDAVPLSRGKIVACIGPITAQAASEAGLCVDVVADDFTVGGLIDALEGALAPAGSSHRQA